MKKIFLLVSLCATFSFAGGSSAQIMKGTVHLGTDGFATGKHEQSHAVIDVVNGEQICTVLTSVFKIEDTKLMSANLISMTCDNETKKISGWLYNSDGNFGFKTLKAGTKVILYVAQAESSEGSEHKELSNNSVQAVISGMSEMVNTIAH
ncbi:MAG: hypothetical protein PHE67_00490 [Campylobacterales bacterium]|nr:hypothetical protein [Campylobacterales bacterium]